LNVKQSSVPFDVTTGVALAALPASMTQPAAADPPRPSETRQSAAPAVESAATAPKIAPAADDGAPSPDAVIKQMQAAIAAGKPRDLLAAVVPDDRLNYTQALAGMLALSVMAAINDPKADMDKATKEVDALLAKHKVTAPIMRPPADLFKGVNVDAFLTEAIAFLKKKIPNTKDLYEMLGVPSVLPSQITVTGETAVGKPKDAAEQQFRRVNGRWFFHVPAMPAFK
jgi:hypothetical protein